MLKLNIKNKIKWDEHRSGWAYVLDLLSAYQDQDGILFDGLVDISFAQWYRDLNRQLQLPYKEDWIGFVHSAVQRCPFLERYSTFENIRTSPEFLKSLETCKGLFTLSEYAAVSLREKIGRHIDIVTIKHPTETPAIKFNMEKFLHRKQIVHAGNWLRRMISFFNLNAPCYEKILLLNPGTLKYLSDEMEYYPGVKLDFQSVEIKQHVSNMAYDKLLGESIVFLHLCDSNATNTIIECIVRNTPLLINRIEPVTEYLGVDYPSTTVPPEKRRLYCRIQRGSAQHTST